MCVLFLFYSEAFGISTKILKAFFCTPFFLRQIYEEEVTILGEKSGGMFNVLLALAIFAVLILIFVGLNKDGMFPTLGKSITTGASNLVSSTFGSISSK